MTTTTTTTAHDEGFIEAGGHSVCDLLMEQASRRAYTAFAQEHSFQANYWRDPRPSERALYQEFSQLAVWNNEADYVNQTLVDNWSKTTTFVWVMATEDTMVWPKEGEQWGAPDPQNPFASILPMKSTEWYQKDLFGLKTAEEAGKNHFESFVGDHLAFTEDDFERWIETYFT
jgi:palmitoyl-protein thioesterase